MADFGGLLLMLLGTAGFAFGLASFWSARRGAQRTPDGSPTPAQPPGTGWKALLLDQSWLTSSVVFAVGLSIREGFEMGEAVSIFLSLVLVGVVLKFGLQRLAR